MNPETNICPVSTTLGPVSYTHLDVYKRQPHRSSLPTVIPPISHRVKSMPFKEESKKFACLKSVPASSIYLNEQPDSSTFAMPQPEKQTFLNLESLKDVYKRQVQAFTLHARENPRRCG